MAARTSILPVKLSDETTVHVMVTSVGSEMDVAAVSRDLSFQAVADSIESIADTLLAALQKVNPTKASVEFGVEFAMEAGKLTALLVNGSSTGSLKVTLEWESRAPASRPRLKRRIT